MYILEIQVLCFFSEWNIHITHLFKAKFNIHNKTELFFLKGHFTFRKEEWGGSPISGLFDGRLKVDTDSDIFGNYSDSGVSEDGSLDAGCSPAFHRKQLAD